MTQQALAFKLRHAMAAVRVRHYLPRTAPYLVLDLTTGTIASVSAAAASLLGEAALDLIGRPIGARCGSLRGATARRSLVSRDGQPCWSGPYTWQRVNGTTLRIELGAIAFAEGAGRLLMALIEPLEEQP